jgi:RimJ/RimL family protein N-acetyltransferase
MITNPFLVGENTYLRPVEISDTNLIQRWHNNPTLRKQSRLGGLPVTYVKEENDIKTARKSREEIYLIIVQKSTDKSIGFIRLNFIDAVSRNMWLRMLIGDKDAQGKGLAEDALRCVVEWIFSEQNVHRITLETYETNKQAMRFFEKIGFVREGLVRDAVYSGGRYFNIVCYGLLNTEYKTRK